MEDILKACALTYPKDADAPYISAVGKGFKAQKILEMAEKNNVPVVKNGEVTDILFLQKPGDLIPEQTYVAIAKIFAFIEHIDRECK